MIRGNHDYRQDKPTEPDMITPLLSFTDKNVCYLDSLGYYIAGTVGFALMPIQHTLLSGSASGRVEEWPEFPKSSGFPSNVTTKIALFHGTVPQHVNISWFGEGYDYILLGDLHKQSINGGNAMFDKIEMENIGNDIFKVGIYNKQTSQTLWGYPSSLIQQTFGESLLGHGFISWDIIENKATMYHVKNDYGLFTVYKNNAKWVIDVSHPLYTSSVNVELVAKQAWCPQNVNIRIKGAKDLSVESRVEVQKLFQDVGININNIISAPIDFNEQVDDNANNVDSQLSETIADLNTPDTWTQFIESSLANESLSLPWNGWKQAILDPSKLLLPSIELTNIIIPVQNKIKDRNTKLKSVIDNYSATTQTGITSKHKDLKLVYMSWSYILCFKDNCFIDFQTLDKKIACINGKNATGKSSLLEVICIALFGENMPSRYNKNNSSAIICQQKPSKQGANTAIVFALDTDKYRIIRNFTYQTDDKTTKRTKDVVLERVLNNGSAFEQVLSGSKAVGDWVKQYIGDIDTFLLSSMITQDSDNDFFSLKPQQQKEKLDKALSLQSASAFKDVLHATVLAYKDIIKELECIYSVVTSRNNYHFDEMFLKEKQQLLVTCNNAIGELQSKIASLETELQGVDTKLVSKGKEYISSLYDQTQRELAQLKCTKTDIEFLLQQKSKVQVEFDLVKDVFDKSLDIDVLQYDVNDMKEGQTEKPNISLDVINNDIDQLRNNIKSLGKQQALSKLISCLTNEIKEMKDSQQALSDIIEKRTEQLLSETTKCNSILELYHTMMNQQPPAPKESVEAYQAWIDAVKSFENAYQSIEQVQQNLQSLSIPDVQRPSYTINELNNTKDRLANWIQKATNVCGIDPFSKKFTVKVSQLQNKISTLQEEIKALSDSYHETDSVLRDCIASRDAHTTKLHLHLESKPDVPKYNEKTKEKTVAKKAFTSLQKEVAAIQTKFLGYNPELDSSIVDRGQELVNSLAIEQSRLNEAMDLRKDCEEHPFNPDCEACRQQPWRRKVTELDDKIKGYQYNVDSILSEMNTICGYCVTETVVKAAKQRLHEYNTCFLPKLSELNVQTSFWEDYKFKEEAYNVWVQEKKAIETALQKVDTKITAQKKRLDCISTKSNNTKQTLDGLNIELHTIQNVQNDLESEYQQLHDTIAINEKAINVWSDFDMQKEKFNGIIDSWTQLEAQRSFWEDEVCKRKSLEEWSANVAAYKSKYENCREFIESLQAHIKEYQDKLKSNCSLMIEKEEELKRNQKNLEALQAHHEELKKLLELQHNWNQWIDTNNKIAHAEKCIKSCITYQQLQAIENDITILKRYQQLFADQDLYEKALGLCDIYNDLVETKSKLIELQQQKIELSVEVAKLEKDFADHQEAVGYAQVLGKYCENLNAMRNTVEAIERYFADYKTWILQTKALPLLCNNVNYILQSMCRYHRPLFLETKFINEDTFLWFIKDGCNTPPYEKASGFQKFITSLAMRITLGKLGVAGMSAKQLFIDEGFTACDSDNLTSVPEFLHGLLTTYDSIIIVSHLDDLKTKSDVFVTINRDDNSSVSHIACGNPYSPYIYVKKVGRPAALKLNKK